MTYHPLNGVKVSSPVSGLGKTDAHQSMWRLSCNGRHVSKRLEPSPCILLIITFLRGALRTACLHFEVIQCHDKNTTTAVPLSGNISNANIVEGIATAEERIRTSSIIPM